jgi:hypothetical protein
MKDTTVVLLAAIVFGLAGAFALFMARRTQKLGAASLTWPTTPGRIVSSELKQSPKLGARPVIAYTYAVASQAYTGTTASFVGTHNLQDAQRLVSAYPAGAEATVYYDPEKPSLAVLEPGAKRATSAWIMGGLLLAFAAAALAFYTAILTR